MRVSIVTSIFNAEKYLEESLSSIVNQTFQDFEIILIDDGSTDGSINILSDFFHKHNNSRLLINKTNQGIPTSRNRALLIAKGEYIAIHDGDDISLPDRLEKEVDYLEQNPDIDVVGAHAYKINYSGSLLGTMSYPPKQTEDFFRVIKRHRLNPIIDPSCLYRKKAIIDNGGYTMDDKFMTVLDMYLWCSLLNNGHHMANIQEPLIKYRINPEGVTQTRTSAMFGATDDLISSFIANTLQPNILSSVMFEQEIFTEVLR